MRQSYALDTRQQQNQRIDPRQILASEILTWTAPELEAAIERELSENPALEVRDNDALPAGLENTGFGAASAHGSGGSAAAPTVLSLVPGAASPSSDSDRFDRESLSGATTSSAGSGSTSTSSSGGDRDDDPMDRVAASTTLHDHLRAQVGQVARDAREAFLVRDLIECVDDRGYLSADLAELAADRAVCVADMEAAVSALQTMDPPGIGARNLHECLLLQATYLDQAGEGDVLAVPLLSRCWDELIARRESKIAQRLGVSAADVRRALDFVQHALTPYPGSAFRPGWGGRSGRGGGSAPAVRPDIIFCRTEAGFAIQVPGDYAPHVMLAPLWQKLAEKPESCKDDGMRRYVREHVERAEGFLHGLQRRGRTLRAIAQALAELQQGYLETGDRAFLRPLTRATLSERLALDESVISRAVADKFAQLPGGDVLPLDAFFGNAHAVRDALAQLIAAENPANPYSDDEIADLLTEQGFPLARRTVAKYRGLEKILPARLRKRA